MLDMCDMSRIMTPMDIATARRQAKLTQEELAKQIGCSRAAVAMWETGATFPEPANAKRLIELLPISLDDIYAQLKAA